MRILYFAWVREAMGTGQEEVTPPAAVATVADLVEWLAARDEASAAALADRTRLRAAVDQEFVGLHASAVGAQEVALFPPVTGG